MASRIEGLGCLLHSTGCVESSIEVLILKVRNGSIGYRCRGFCTWFNVEGLLDGKRRINFDGIAMEFHFDLLWSNLHICIWLRLKKKELVHLASLNFQWFGINNPNSKWGQICEEWRSFMLHPGSFEELAEFTGFTIGLENYEKWKNLYFWSL